MNFNPHVLRTNAATLYSTCQFCDTRFFTTLMILPHNDHKPAITGNFQRHTDLCISVFLSIFFEESSFNPDIQKIRDLLGAHSLCNFKFFADQTHSRLNLQCKINSEIQSSSLDVFFPNCCFFAVLKLCFSSYKPPFFKQKNKNKNN